MNQSINPNPPDNDGTEEGAEELRRGEIVSDRFVVKSPIGSGGMGRIYLAHQRPFNRPVALKVMHRKALENRELVERFFQEASTVSHLAHPNTVTVYDFGRTRSGLLYIAMELVDGISLGDEIRRRKRLPADEAIPYAIQIAQSLGEAHHKGLIHRDLKPDNVMVCQPEGSDPFVKVLDFGIAKVLGKDESWTKVGNIVGTPFYMAPEQAKGNEIDGRTDLYSLGCCLYEMLTGNPPYFDESPVKVLMSHQNDPIPTLPKGFHPALDDFIRRAMAKDPDDRPPDAATFAAELLATTIEMRADDAMSGQFTPPPSTELVPRFDSPPQSFGSRESSPNLAARDREDSPARSVGGSTGRTADRSPGPTPHDSTRRPTELESAQTLDPENGREESLSEVRARRDSIPGESGPRPGASNPGFVTSSAESAAASAASWRTLAVALGVLVLVAIAFIAGRSLDNPFERDATAQDALASVVDGPNAVDQVDVNIDSQPHGAVIYVNDLAVGTTPVSVRRSTAEPIDVRIEHPGFEDFEMTGVELSTSAENRIFAPMKPKPLSVTVQAPIAGTQVYLNDNSHGAIPPGVERTFQLAFPNDALTVRLEAPGYDPFIDRVDAELLGDSYRVAPSRDVFVKAVGEPAANDVRAREDAGEITEE